MVARIYRPAKTWVLEHEAEAERTIDPLMGWTGSSETLGQLRLRFRSKDECIVYAKKTASPMRRANPTSANLKSKSTRTVFAKNWRVAFSGRRNILGALSSAG